MEVKIKYEGINPTGKKKDLIEKSIYSKFNERISKIENVLGEDSPSNYKIISEIKKISVESLPYDYNSFGSFIDSETMKVHYNKHYKGYVENGKRQGFQSRSKFSFNAMKEKLESVFTAKIPEFPKQVQLQLPKLKKIELPKLKKVEA